MNLLVNIDVDDLERAVDFYARAFGLRVGRRLGPDVVEMLGLDAPLYLLRKKAGGGAVPGTDAIRDYGRHWTPVHLDIVVADIEEAMARAKAAGAVVEKEIASHVWGKIALFADPFGHGFCLIEFTDRGYDAIASA
ncbi:VOC family protein [Parvibaculum sp.]|uniref:VOC family protein n=1 Tax=Parvibaculum sp. TaxID=2024848 RepID=UPI002C7F7486|nr:VOC family protein [Parvibaculum sp.]HUD50631.1 VOC family protein [Parvibaculum sp.]